MKLKDLFEGQNVSADADVKGLTADSRKVQEGFVFAALKGVARDGREFIPMALERALRLFSVMGLRKLVTLLW